jgi:hypothetical protein
MLNQPKPPGSYTYAEKILFKKRKKKKFLVEPYPQSQQLISPQLVPHPQQQAITPQSPSGSTSPL